MGVSLLAGLAVAGCATADDVLGTSSSELNLVDVGYLGSIRSGQTKSVTYTRTPTFRSYGFDAKGNDQIVAEVHSPGGDGMGYITDADGQVLAQNDDVAPNVLDSRVTYTVPPGPSRQLRIVFRDYQASPIAMSVKLTVTTNNPGVCSYGGQSYDVGDQFDALDACNRCTCNAGGAISCGKLTCNCDPAQEPWNSYRGTPTQCVGLLYSCSSGEQPFSNSCGCGCGRPHY